MCVASTGSMAVVVVLAVPWFAASFVLWDVRMNHAHYTAPGSRVLSDRGRILSIRGWGSARGPIQNRGRWPAPRADPGGAYADQHPWRKRVSRADLRIRP